MDNDVERLEAVRRRVAALMAARPEIQSATWHDLAWLLQRYDEQQKTLNAVCAVRDAWESNYHSVQQTYADISIQLTEAGLTGGMVDERVAALIIARDEAIAAGAAMLEDRIRIIDEREAALARAQEWEAADERRSAEFHAMHAAYNEMRTERDHARRVIAELGAYVRRVNVGSTDVERFLAEAERCAGGAK